MMRVTLRTVTGLAVAALTSLAVCAAAGTRPSVETRVLLGPGATFQWSPVEATLTPAVLEGVETQLFRVPVDWKTGEPNYPIGWPRISLELPAGQQDWRGWDELRVRMLGRISQGQLPFRPFGLTLNSTEPRVGWERDVPALEPGKWEEFTFDLREIPFLNRVKSVGIFISEDKYADGTVAEFYVARLELVRYTVPALVEFAPLSPVAFADDKALAVRVKTVGLREGKSAAVELRLQCGATVAATRRLMAPAGETRLSVSLPPGLPAGDYTLSARLGGSRISSPVRLVPSPWQESR